MKTIMYTSKWSGCIFGFVLLLAIPYMFEFGFLPYQKASTIGKGVFHSRESEQGVGGHMQRQSVTLTPATPQSICPTQL